MKHFQRELVYFARCMLILMPALQNVIHMEYHLAFILKIEFMIFAQSF